MILHEEYKAYGPVPSRRTGKSLQSDLKRHLMLFMIVRRIFNEAKRGLPKTIKMKRKF